MTDIPLDTLIPAHGRIGSVIDETGMEVYLVGGAIRDYLLKKATLDFDFVVFSDPERFARAFSDVVCGRLVVLDEKEKTYRVVSGGIEYDFSPPKGKDLAADARMRDFTINSLFADASVSPSPILSPTGGMEDLGRGIIRASSDGVFTDDPLRLLRAFRFRAVLGFRIEKKTAALIGAHAALIAGVSRERLADELAKLFSGPYAFAAIRSMDEAGLLTTIFPELAPMKGVQQNRWHTKDVWGHCLAALREIEGIAKDPERFFPGRGDDIARYLDFPLGGGWRRGSLLGLIALAHDVGKPERRFVREDGESAFWGHENLGEEIFGRMARRIILNRKAVRFGRTLIKNHMRLLSLSVSKKVTGRAVARLARDAGDAVPALLILGLADTLAGRADQERVAEGVSLIDEILTIIDRSSRQTTPFLNGTEIMEILGIGEGEIVGRVKADLSLAQAAGEVRSKRGARAFIRERIKSYE
jgi:poly(A) polymerase